MNDNLRDHIAKLTYNAAVSLRSVDEEVKGCELVGGKRQLGRPYTGMGKWTTIAANGVINNLLKAGAVEIAPGTDVPVLTPLGEELNKYLRANWESGLTFAPSRKK